MIDILTVRPEEDTLFAEENSMMSTRNGDGVVKKVLVLLISLLQYRSFYETHNIGDKIHNPGFCQSELWQVLGWTLDIGIVLIFEVSPSVDLFIPVGTVDVDIELVHDRLNVTTSNADNLLVVLLRDEE